MLTKNEQCFLKILTAQSEKLMTAEILQMTELFPNLCSGCKSGSHVIAAGQNLIKMGKVIREIGKGGFYWGLKN